VNADRSHLAKEVNHVEFDLARSGLLYEPGDALGVYPKNCPALVNVRLCALGCDGEEGVVNPRRRTFASRSLTDRYDLGKAPPELLAALHLETIRRGPPRARRPARRQNQGDSARRRSRPLLEATTTAALLHRIQPKGPVPRRFISPSVLYATNSPVDRRLESVRPSSPIAAPRARASRSGLRAHESKHSACHQVVTPPSS
jgi:sulfite reductase alpha subunit-like flavoprotein